MIKERQIHSSEKKFYRVLIFLIVGLAAFSSAMNELNQVQQLTIQTGELLATWSDMIVPTASASTPVVSTSCVESSVPQNVNQSDEFRWSGNIPAGSAVEIRGINGEIIADSTNGSEVQVVALKRSRRSDVNSVQIKVVQHAGGVTICALYPNDEGAYPSSCGFDAERSDRTRESSQSVKVRNNDVNVDFTVHVPARVSFIGKTINGGISATSLSGNVVARTVNGGIKISTTGYAEATTVNGEITARFSDASWPSSLSFKTVNGEISLDLPANVSAAVEAQTLNGTINSDFPLEVTNLKGRKYVKATIGSGGRELVLQTLNGSINLRVAG